MNSTDKSKVFRKADGNLRYYGLLAMLSDGLYGLDPRKHSRFTDKMYERIDTGKLKTEREIDVFIQNERKLQ